MLKKFVTNVFSCSFQRLVNQTFHTVYLILIVASVTGCAMTETFDNAPSTDILKVSDNVYEIMDVDYRGIFGTEASLMERNVRKAETFAKDQGKVAIPILARNHRYAYGSEFSWFYYKFALVDPDTPEAKIKFSDLVVVRDLRSSKDFFNHRNEAEQEGIYEKLMQLDDLRKKGVITNAEFEQQKKKLLSTL